MARFIQNRHSLNIKTNDSNNLGNVFRYSYPNSKKDILYPEFDISIKRSNTMVVSKRLSNESNKSVESQDSGIGLSKADYEIRRAIKAQRVVERPHIIVIQKGKPIMTNYNNYIEDPDADAHMVISAATASKRHRREIAVMQKRNTMTSSSSSSPSLSSSSSLSPQPSLYYYNPEKENVFNGFEFTRNNIETDVIEENLYSGKRKPRGCSFLKHKASIKKVSSALKKFVGKEKGFIACVYA